MRRILLIALGFLMLAPLCFLSVSLFQPDKATITIASEELPQSSAEIPRGWNSPFGLVWSKGADSLEYIGSSNGEKVITLSVFSPDSDSYEHNGISRADGLRLYGPPITTLRALNVSDFNNDYRIAFKQDRDILILFFDTTLDKAVFSCTVDSSFAEATQLFTGDIHDSFSTESYEPLLFDMINTLRDSYGKESFSGDYRLNSLASNYSGQMAMDNFFGHVSPGGEVLDDRMKTSGVPYTVAGENLCAGQTTPMDAIAAWLNSPPHREVLLGDYDAAGIGVAASDQGYHVYYALEAVIYIKSFSK